MAKAKYKLGKRSKYDYLTLGWIALGIGAFWWFTRMRQSAEVGDFMDKFRAETKANAPRFSPVPVPLPPKVLAYINDPAKASAFKPADPSKIESVVVAPKKGLTYWNYYTAEGTRASLSYWGKGTDMEGVIGTHQGWAFPNPATAGGVRWEQ